jgi:osmoprotectant transport system substrate-binding protein
MRRSPRAAPPPAAGLLGTAVLLVALLCGCAGPPAGDGPPADRGIRIASYDFPENQTLAEVYAEALRRAGMEVTVQHGIGTREVVFPALEQGVVDVVVDYLGTTAEFLEPGAGSVHDQPGPLREDLAADLAPRGLTVLAAARAEDQNGFVVLTELAERLGVRLLSQLAPVAPSLVFGGPPECADRPFCLPGLREVYGVTFAEVRSMTSRAATVEALLAGQVDVGMLETTDPRLSDASLLLLIDDRSLQPRENVVPLVRTAVADDRLRAALDEVSAQLTTLDLVGLNRAVAVDGASPREAALRWWDGR